jgi:hypothetical protein
MEGEPIMGEGQQENTKSFDPFEPFREMRDAYLDSMAKVMVETVNTDGYAQANGAMLDSYLTASAPFREALEKWMVQTLQQLSLPSRQEVAALAERFTNMEMRLDDVDAKLDQIARLIVEARPAAASRPAEPAKSAAPSKSPDLAGSKASAHAKRGIAAAQKSTRRQSGRKSER